VQRHLGHALVALPSILVALWFGGIAALLPAVLMTLAATALLVGRGWRRQAELAAALDAVLRGEPSPPLPTVASRHDTALTAAALRLAMQLRDTEKRLARSRRTIELMFDALPDPALLVDRRLDILRANRAARVGLGLEALPTPLFAVLRDPALVSAVEAALATEQAVATEVAPPGEPSHQFTAHVLALPSIAGETSQDAFILLRETGEQMAVERMRSDFVANVSHELRTPLSILTSAIETLQGPARDDPGARAEFLQMMGAEARRMTRLVDDLLSLSRIEASVSRPPADPCELEPILRAVAARFAQQAEREGVALDVRIASRLPAVRGDADQLEQLLANLVSNALTYGAGGGRVIVEVGAAARAPSSAGPLAGSGAVCLCVIDFGEGIPPEHIPRLTERFYRVDRTRSRASGGTGLGLAIVKHILRRHRGHLSIASRPGAGSRFCAWLPALEPVRDSVTKPSQTRDSCAPETD